MKALSNLSTVSAGEAITMEGCVLVADAALVDHLRNIDNIDTY